MHVFLTVPGLTTFLATSTQPAPALALLFARSGYDPQAVPSQLPALPLADLGRGTAQASARMLGDAPQRDSSATWLCADPVHLHFAREHLLLADATYLDLQQAEADALVEALNTFFRDVEPDFGGIVVAAPDRWYLKLTARPMATFSPVDDVIGRPVAAFLPEGEDAAYWRRMMNEAQVLLHNHPVNAAREARGQRAINGLWLWGAGDLPEELHCPFRTVLTQDPVVRGLARACGAEVLAPGSMSDLPEHDCLVVLDDLHKPSLYRDVERWEAGLARLERDWFAPLVEALRHRRVDELTLYAPGEHDAVALALRPIDLWKFWRRPRSFSVWLPHRNPD